MYRYNHTLEFTCPHCGNMFVLDKYEYKEILTRSIQGDGDCIRCGNCGGNLPFWFNRTTGVFGFTQVLGDILDDIFYDPENEPAYVNCKCTTEPVEDYTTISNFMEQESRSHIIFEELKTNWYAFYKQVIDGDLKA